MHVERERETQKKHFFGPQKRPFIYFLEHPPQNNIKKQYHLKVTRAIPSRRGCVRVYAGKAPCRPLNKETPPFHTTSVLFAFMFFVFPFPLDFGLSKQTSDCCLLWLVVFGKIYQGLVEHLLAQSSGPCKWAYVCCDAFRIVYWIATCTSSERGTS